MNTSDDFPTIEDYSRLLSKFPLFAEDGWKSSYFGDPASNENGLRSAGNAVLTYALISTENRFITTLGQSVVKRCHEYALRLLRYMTESHVVGNGLCADGGKWGGDWQSSWWTARMALGANLLWQKLDADTQEAVRNVIAYEADIHLQRKAATGLFEDTKAEENAWDTEILAAASVLLPNHKNAFHWQKKLIEFALNTLSAPQDHWNDALIAGAPLHQQVYTVNVHSDFTLENHGAYHFCYIASVLQSVSLSCLFYFYAGKNPPEALLHNVQPLWARAKTTFLNTRFAYISGKDWARYTYGLYFIVPALALIQHKLKDSDARNIENLRVKTLYEEQQYNSDGSFFGKRLTGRIYSGQFLKYETDCYACLCVAYLMHSVFGGASKPTKESVFQKRISACHVSPESGVAWVRTKKLFSSFSWSTLGKGLPTIQFFPTYCDSIPEWIAGNYLGEIKTIRSVKPVGVKYMVKSGEGFLVKGSLDFRTRRGESLYELSLSYQVIPEIGCAKLTSKIVARANLWFINKSALNAAVVNDFFNGFRRTIFSEEGDKIVAFTPSAHRAVTQPSFLQRALHYLNLNGKSICIGKRWLNIDNQLGIVNLNKDSEFHLHTSPLNGNGLNFQCFKFDRKSFQYCVLAGREIFNTAIVLHIGSSKETESICKNDDIHFIF